MAPAGSHGVTAVKLGFSVHILHLNHSLFCTFLLFILFLFMFVFLVSLLFPISCSCLSP